MIDGEREEREREREEREGERGCREGGRERESVCMFFSR